MQAAFVRCTVWDFHRECSQNQEKCKCCAGTCPADSPCPASPDAGERAHFRTVPQSTAKGITTAGLDTVDQALKAQ